MAKRNAALSPEICERIYAGVLGKLIGVYLGRAVEGWRYEDIRARFGEIRNYRPPRSRHAAHRAG